MSIFTNDFKPAAVATLANENALEDLEFLFRTLELWNNPPPRVYIYCDTKSLTSIHLLNYKGELHIKEALNAYTGLNRTYMERKEGVDYPTLFGDFTVEKISLMEWALSDLSYENNEKQKGVLFCDADIFFLGPLPTIESTYSLALSPHYIRKKDTRMFGKYNAGFLWTNSLSVLSTWREACKTSRFFEQAALEDLETFSPKLFGHEHNYGWWRLWQGERPSIDLKEQWTIRHRFLDYSGICIVDKPLSSIHTHMCDSRDVATMEYNSFVYCILKLCTRNPKVTILLELIDKRSPFLKELSKNRV